MAAPIPPEAVPPPSRPPSAGSILVADDDPVFRALLMRTLERENYRCTEVADAPTAMQRLGQEEFELVISDIDMPGNRDLELLNHVGEHHPALPIILITGHPTVETAARCVGHRVAGYLMKPFEPAELLALVGAGINHYRIDRAIRRSQDQLATWGRDLASIRDYWRNPSSGNSNVPLQTFLKLSLDHLIGALVDFRSLVGSLAKDSGASRAYDSLRLAAALKETVAVLQRTRHECPSDELADLRRRLEKILKDPAQPFRPPAD